MMRKFNLLVEKEENVVEVEVERDTHFHAEERREG